MWSLIKRTVLVDMAAIAMLCVCVLGPAVMGHGNNPGDITQAPADECIERCVRVCGAGRICEYEIEVDGSYVRCRCTCQDAHGECPDIVPSDPNDFPAATSRMLEAWDVDLGLQFWVVQSELEGWSSAWRE
jgi:hypothetical protein